ncbi:ATP-dependent DNA helicase [Pseudomonas sp. TTU2014-080ASC]|uniref:ATP-dependent DNA helicase n=1 Tax=Pseudomonas sp. TTU2014-080ASC TaxID=1729724 RepID=UPI0007189E6B|nr:ATP-dependent RecD-like DNA helicase [Pseudomonas sp. TTU2014-080ASC]KRW61613.1 helicase [Pseudomonas sp. TTU2014-080ASC]
MATIKSQIQCADSAICQNIEKFNGERGFLSQNLLPQLRNLVEGISVLIQEKNINKEFKYSAIKPALKEIQKTPKLNFIYKFHELLQKSASHFTFDADTSERLILKYYEYLYRLRTTTYNEFNFTILQNLESLPINLDPALKEYHEKIVEIIKSNTTSTKNSKDRYYIHKITPFVCNNRIYYEVTFYRATNKVNKSDRIIAFSESRITENHATLLTLKQGQIEVFGYQMPITIIHDWETSIRPCEFNNLAKILGIKISARSNSDEYTLIMRLLTEKFSSLLQIIELPETEYESIKLSASINNARPIIFPILDKARKIIKPSLPGSNILRYLILRMNNQIIKNVYYNIESQYLSRLHISNSSIPFETMPLCTSLPGHNPRYWDLIEAIDPSSRVHELLARRIHNSVEQHGQLYTPLEELKIFGDVEKIVQEYNKRIYITHKHRKIVIDKKHAFISGYEDDTHDIIKEIQTYTSAGISGYTSAIERWITDTNREIDDPSKRDALKNMFCSSRVAVIYGAAGTGKSTTIDHISNYFNDKSKLFLAHTHPATDNLKRKIKAQNSTFKTISSHIKTSTTQEYDLLVIDECSTVSNTDLLRTLKKTKYKLLLLVGDIYQIESIQFGNWFDAIRSYIPKASVFELKTPYRTSENGLLTLWEKLRTIDHDLTETMAHNGYSAVLNESLFTPQEKDEIILCLNYDGLYGINNINRFLQSSNPSPTVTWRESTYKVGDPVLFHETERFRPVIYNNLKGKIVDIVLTQSMIQFDVKLDRPLTELDVDNSELEWVGDSTVRFCVYSLNNTDDDDDSLNTTVPFQVAYAVSIHKAQGLEYDSVKIVITTANEDDITHSILYTAITRARKKLKLFWSPETQNKVLKNLTRRNNTKDVNILSARRGLVPIK